MAYISFQPNDHFNTKLYSGTGSSNALTGVGFQPDWVWIKCRTDGQNHALYDAVRGVQKKISSSSSAAEATATTELSAFGSDGFTVLTDGQVNASGQTYASWNWKLGTTSGITTNGSTTITPVAYSFNATTGMSAIKCTGTGAAGLFPHGLGVAPKIVISKRLNDTNSWFVQTDLISSWTASNYLVLNTTAAVGSNTGIINATDATNVSLAGADDWVNKSGDSYIHYCFAEKKGFSKFGTYTGNGNVSGPMIYTGFSPAAVFAKKHSGTGDWILWDNKRGGYNETIKRVYPNDPAVEESSVNQGVDFLSNGFKLRGTSSNAWNSGNDKYIYLAFAAEPLVASNGTPATAR